MSVSVLEQVNYEVQVFAHETGLDALLDSLGAKSPSSLAHSERVKSLALLGAAENPEVSLSQLKIIGVSGLSHDVGKQVGDIPYLADLPRKLTEEEYRIVAKHSTFGYDMLTSLASRQGSLEDRLILAIAAVVARDHHKPIDTSSYIDMLRSEITAADRLDASRAGDRLYLSSDTLERNRSRDPAELLDDSDLKASGGSVPRFFGRLATDFMRSLGSTQSLAWAETSAA